MEVGFPEEEGWLTILDSGYIHNGGGKPRNATDDKVRVWCMKANNPAGTDCIFSITSSRVSYDMNACVISPPWADPNHRSA